MSKLDVFLWLTVKCYGEVLLTNLRKSQTNLSTKKIHLRGKGKA